MPASLRDRINTEEADTKKGDTVMSRHWLGTLVGLCMLGLAAPTWAVPMSATQIGEVTEILEPEFALDYVVGTPVTLLAEWDTDDFIDLVEFGWLPGFFFVSVLDNPRASLSFTAGSHTWIETDEFVFLDDLGPGLLFDADGDLLGARFIGLNSDGDVFASLVILDMVNHIPPGRFLSGGPEGPGALPGVEGFLDVPGWDGNFPAFPPPVAEPGTLGLWGGALLALVFVRRRAGDGGHR